MKETTMLLLGIVKKLENKGLVRKNQVGRSLSVLLLEQATAELKLGSWMQ
ncbi:MAG: hypothetical protein ACXACY_31030 [Candidatus Hodarchaeales archaeon]